MALIIGLIGGILALVDGIIRVRGRGTAILAVIEIIVAALFLISFIPSWCHSGRVILAVVLLIVLVLQLILRGSTRRSGAAITVIAIVLLVIWIVVALGWVAIPGLN